MKPISQIPILNYFDEDIARLERAALFDDQPVYLGAASSLPNSGDFRVLERLRNEKILVNDQGQMHLLENRCSHRQARLATGQGRGSHFVCPLHHWRYGLDGKCLATPLIQELDKAQLAVPQNPLTRLHDLLFAGPRSEKLVENLRSFPFYPGMKIENMVFQKTYSELFECNWKHYIEVFAENYHVPYVHPGFSQFVDLGSLEWFRHPEFTGQVLRAPNQRRPGARKLTPKYAKWMSLLQEYTKGQPLHYSGILILYYPNIIIECYPFCMAIGTLHPQGSERFLSHVDFYHDRYVLENQPEIAAAAEEALNETEMEDKEMCYQLAAGRKTLAKSSEAPPAYFQEHLEIGLQEFYQYYHRQMELAKVPRQIG